MDAAGRRGPSLFLPLLIALAFLAGYFQICDNDVWWHIRTGEIILDTARIPRIDPFSHLAEGHYWITHSWASDVVIALASRAAGLRGVVIGKCAVVAGLAALLWVLARRAGASAPAAFAAIALALAAARFRFFERPHLATFLFLPLLLAMLARIVARPEERLVRRDFVIPLILLAWVNFHGGFLFGLMVFPVFFAIAAVCGARARLGAWSPSARRVAILFALSAVATLINPNGIDAHLYPAINERALQVVRNGEWFPPRLHQFPLFFVLAALVAALALTFWRAAGPERLLPLVPLAYLAFRSNRSIGEFAIAAAVPLALLFDAAAARVRLAPRVRVAAALALAGALVALHAGGHVINPIFYRFGGGVNEALFPIAASNYAERAGLEGKMANSPGFGGYLIWRFWPERKVFADGRLDVYVDVNETLVRTPWRRTLDERGLTYAILESESGGLGDDPLTAAIAEAPDWALVYWDDAAMVWARDLPAHRAVIARDVSLVADPRRDPSAIPDDSLAIALAEYERASSSPHPYHALFGLGLLRLRTGDAARAAEALTRAAAIRPHDPVVWNNLAFARLAVRDAAGALDAARHAVRLARGDAFALRNLGAALFDLARYAEAADALEKASLLLPANSDIGEMLRESRRRANAEGSTR
ncbi:MAG: hypothetical protein ACKVU1_15290 [bacterium]